MNTMDCCNKRLKSPYFQVVRTIREEHNIQSNALCDCTKPNMNYQTAFARKLNNYNVANRHCLMVFNTTISIILLKR